MIPLIDTSAPAHAAAQAEARWKCLLLKLVACSNLTGLQAKHARWKHLSALLLLLRRLSRPGLRVRARCWAAAAAAPMGSPSFLLSAAAAAMAAAF